jgi:hypothetical protein
MTELCLSEAEKELRRRARDDLIKYAAACLKIRTKDGTIAPLCLNKAQRHIHERLGEQLTTTGKVRALILKGRQQGCSTYVAARFYHRVTQHPGVETFILTHDEDATRNLFAIVERFHLHCLKDIKARTGVDNAKELRFPRLDSGYKVGTAGNKSVGRSSTLQLFHGSEVAFWPHAEMHGSGILQAIAGADDTEAILESTAHGVGSWFHRHWRDAEAGIGEFIAIFVPWYWQEEYRVPPPAGFTLDAEERDYAALYNLDRAQMAWRRNKIAELRDPILFKQEYPATAAEAFQMSGHDSFIKPELVLKARKTTCEASGPLIVGYDPAWKGADRHALARRRGRRLLGVECRQKLDTMQAAGWLKQVIQAEGPARVFIDVGGVGAGVYDRLMEMGYGRVVAAVNFGSEPFEPALPDGGGPKNRRAEMWMKSREWLEDAAGADIPDEDSLQADACGPTYSYDSNTRLLLESKEHMRARGVPSPDEWDAVALTFAEPVAPAFDVKRFMAGARAGW